MANKLTSEGLTVGSSTLTNIVKDWGGGSIFCGFADESSGPEKIEIRVDPVKYYYLPLIGVGEIKLATVVFESGTALTVTMHLPSAGKYIYISSKYRRMDFIFTPSIGFGSYIDENGRPGYAFPGIELGGFGFATVNTSSVTTTSLKVLYYRIR